jgi:hypothetical protein
MGDLVLLLEVGVLLQVDLLGAGFFEGAVVAAVARQLAIFEMQVTVVTASRNSRS